MVPTRWSDWSSSAEAAYRDLAGRCERVFAAGLSMGGSSRSGLPNVTRRSQASSWSTHWSTRRPRVSATCCRAWSKKAASGPCDRLRYRHAGFSRVRLQRLADRADALDVRGHRRDRRPSRRSPLPCPAAVEPDDHVVPPESGDLLAAQAAGPVERVWLERSFHVATLDYDAPGDRGVCRRLCEQGGSVAVSDQNGLSRPRTVRHVARRPASPSKTTRSGATRTAVGDLRARRSGAPARHGERSADGPPVPGRERAARRCRRGEPGPGDGSRPGPAGRE